jgi:hypothetical protein
MALAHSPDVLVRNVFLLALAGVIAEVVVMVVLPHVNF